ncbi:uncharacterized protein LOC125062661 isoform X1 [Pieris napi]|uniref:uncharacterized protein LOC125062661 isoform X1 n=2 Tax=Pieris napi TaxID=78633 RepID=UPI001FBABF8C|nr:uncharacterized protein LOC125062661 isoform X1 [Pieris napi]
MGPKKPGKDTEDEYLWRTCIEEAALDDDTWKVKVILFEAAGSDQDRLYLNKFEVYAAEERRFVIKNICKTETIFMVNQLGGEKKVKDENLRVFEEGQSYLKEKRDIPADILALIIKKLILKMKDEYLFIKRQKLEVREGIRRESNTMINRAEVRGTVIVKAPEPVEPAPEIPKGKGKKGEQEIPEVPETDEDKKYNTQLRVRGEEWRDKVYVDDFPTDGPNIYVAVTGFVEPYLAESLIKIGIPLTAVVQIRINPADVRIPSSLFRATKRGQSQTDLIMEQSLKFWDDLQQLRIQKQSADYFKGTAFLEYSPPYWQNENLSGESEKIYDELCYLMYDVQDLTRQHVHYLENVDIVNVPEDESDGKFNNFYCRLIEDIPLECVTVYSILDSILQTVSKNDYFGETTSQTSLSTAVTINQPRQNSKNDDKADKAEHLVKGVFNALCSTDAKTKSYRISYGEEYENHKNPLIINFGDVVKYNTFHLGNLNLDNLVKCMLFGMPTNNLWCSYDYPRGELEAKIQFHINILLSCFDRTDVETTELNRLLHILACRKLYNNRSSLKKHHLPISTITEFKKIYLKRSILAEPLPKCSSVCRVLSTTSPSFPSMLKSNEDIVQSPESDEETYRMKFLFECPDISELVSAAEIANRTPVAHIIDDFEYFEDFSGSCAFQTMTEAFYKFNCLDYKYCEVTDCLIMMFFNSHDSDGISREEWRCHLPTPCCLQDFFDFVLEEQYDWIQKEEKFYDEEMALKSESECKVLTGEVTAKSCVENSDIQMELLIEGSLKHKEFIEAENAEPEDSEIQDSEFKKSTKSPSESEMESKSSKKAKSPTASTPKPLKSLQTTASAMFVETPKKPFSGYDLGDRRVEVFGKDSIYFSQDGTRVTSTYSLMIPNNLEYISLNIIPGNRDNTFWMHKALGDSLKPETVDTCESFRIVSKNNVIIYVKKQSYEVPLPTLATISLENAKQKESTVKSPNLSSKLSNTIPQLFETISFYSLFVTWPNGLVTETIHEHNSHQISHIKQYNIATTSNLNEEMRCISLNGEVVVFKIEGDIEILRPDGSYILITNCQKRRICNDLEETISETSSEKNKKGKVKGKEKPSKASSKSSKNVIIEEDVSENKVPEYELVIEEYITIDTNGLKEKWINDNSFFIEKLLVRTATDYCLGEVFSRRMDGTHILLNKEGLQSVTFSNGTRIITQYFIEDEEVYPEWNEEELLYFSLIESDTGDNDTYKSKGSESQKSVDLEEADYSSSYVSETSRKVDEEVNLTKTARTDGFVSVQILYTIEHPNFTTVTINKSSGNVTIDSPNETSVTINNKNNFNFFMDNVTTACFNGENLDIIYEACSGCRSKTKCTVKIKHEEMSSVTQIQRNWLKMEDSFGKKIVVNDEGSISVSSEAVSEEVLVVDEICQNGESVQVGKKPTLNKSASTMSTHGKCREIYQAKNMRYFILKRDLTCSELLHRSVVEDYKKDCRWQPWCSINRYNTFGDHRSIVSILTPVHRNESEKWLMESKLADKPKYLTYKDLKKDSGKGFYHWMRPYERFKPKPRKPDNVLPDRLPCAYLFRVVEQQWNENEREELKGGKELLYAILRYRHVIESDSKTILNIPIIDLRPEDERRTDCIIQAIAHRTYEELKTKLAEDVQSRVKMTITTKEPPSQEEMSIDGEMDDGETTGEFKSTEEISSLVQEVAAAEELSSNLKRYWRRRGEEYKEEQFYQYLLREGSVPPYFRNVLGGAIWWEMNNAAGEAATVAERKKMKCPCPDEEVSDIPPFM